MYVGETYQVSLVRGILIEVVNYFACFIAFMLNVCSSMCVDINKPIILL